MKNNSEKETENMEEKQNKTVLDELNDAAIPLEPKAKEEDLPLDDWHDKYIRLYSEFDNYRKRTTREKSDWMKTAGEDMLKKMLPIFDDFERAMDAHKKSGHTEALKPSAFEEGIYLIFHKLQHTFEAVGLKAMDSKGVDFNSDYHEAIAKIPAPDAAQKGKIIDTVEKGYLFNGKIIRHAKVVIGE